MNQTTEPVRRKLNMSRSYGTVMGHDKAKYEQDGLLFDPNGLEIVETKPAKSVAKKPVEPEKKNLDEEFEFDRTEAEMFLKTRLADGPIAVLDLKNESEALELKWEIVKTRFAELGGKERKKGNAILWSLPKK